MFQTFVDNHCADLPDAERVRPFGPDTIVWRVRGHMFAAYTQDGQGLSIRARQSRFSEARQRLDPPRPPSFPTGGGWVMLPWETPPDELRARIDESYRLVRRDWPNAIPRKPSEASEND